MRNRKEDDNFVEDAAKAAAKEAREIANGVAKEGRQIAEGAIKGILDAFNLFS